MSTNPTRPSRLLRRRELGQMACAAIACAALPVRAQATRIRVSIIPIVDTAPLQVAIAKGFFAAEGLEVDTTPSAGGAVGLPALAAGQVQIAFSNIISIVLGAKQGLGFQVVAAGVATTENAPDPAGLAVRKGAPYKTGKDLEGKRVAVNTRNGVLWLFAREWVRATGGNPDKVTYLEVPFPQMADALRGDRVDAAFITEPFLSAALAGEAALLGWPYNTVQKRFAVGMYASTRQYIEQQPAVIEKFARAHQKAIDWVNANQSSDEWIRIVAAHTRLAPESIRSMTAPAFEKTVDPASVEATVGRMQRNNMFEGPFDARGLLYRTALR